MPAIAGPLEPSRRLSAVDAALRGAGIALLAFCATASLWLCRAVQHAPAHPPTAREVAGAASAVLGWSFGWALLVEGRGLFARVPVPPRHARFVPHEQRSLT